LLVLQNFAAVKWKVLRYLRLCTVYPGGLKLIHFVCFDRLCANSVNIFLQHANKMN
jgi:hypothetical protein